MSEDMSAAAPHQPPERPDRPPQPDLPPVVLSTAPLLFGEAEASGPTTEPPATRHRRRAGGLFAVLAACLVLALLAGFTGGWLANRRGAGAITMVEPGSQSTTRPTDSVAGVAAKVLPSVVSIETRSPRGQGTGSGFVLRQDGYILTNNHVVADAATGGQIQVLYADGGQESAKIVGRTTSYDLAVLKVNRSDVPALELGDSSAVVVGDPVIAVGAPLGLESTVTSGIISALNRPVAAGQGQDSAFINAIQTDAAINPGNSGGPLVDAQGRVIGINSAIARAPGTTGSSGGNIGLGFAIPSAQAGRTAQQLIEEGHATYPVIGVLLDRTYDGEGVQVSTRKQDGVPPVTPDGPAARAGIKPGDVIVGFEGRPVAAPDQLIVAIRAQRPGDTVTLKVRSGDRTRDVEVTLDESAADD
ncbi:MAG TPA: trypsin-like peptidase domain-containing protein [Actinomycetales bacterium]|nr:trypsin-like peptidase domain-containing protein [Actinomycetales bacterium]